MSINPKYIINAANKTASLDVFNEEVIVNTYNYANDEVTLSAIEEVQVFTLKQLLTNINSVIGWIQLINRLIKPVSQKRNLFDDTMDKKNSKITAVLKIDNDKIVDVEFDSNNLLSSFNTRDEVTINFEDFIEWNLFIQRFYNNSLNF